MGRSPLREELIAENAQLRSLVAEIQESHRVEIARMQETFRAELAALTQEVADLKARLGQGPHNSHKPPSSEGYEKPAPKSRRTKSGKSSGGQLGHPGRTLSQVPDPDQVVVHEPVACSGCGSSLLDAPVVGIQRRQVFELPPIMLETTEHQLVARRCACGVKTVAVAPAGVNAPAQYGPVLKAVGTYLLSAQYLPLGRTAQLFSEIFGLCISQGTLVRWRAEAASGLGTFDTVLKDLLIQAPVVGADETGIRVNGSLKWAHVARTDKLTRYTVSDKRGLSGMEEAGVLKNLAADAVLVSDFWGPYFRLEVLHAMCGAHLCRELVAAAETTGQGQWATALERLLNEANEAAHQARDAGDQALDPEVLATIRARYERLIGAGWEANPDHPPGPRSAKGARPKHVNLLHRMGVYLTEILRFTTDLRLPFTNNGSEQDVRPLKIQMKVSGGLRSLGGAQEFLALRSYLSTARKQGQSAYTVLRQLHAGDAWMPSVAC